MSLTELCQISLWLFYYVNSRLRFSPVTRDSAHGLADSIYLRRTYLSEISSTFFVLANTEVLEVLPNKLKCLFIALVVGAIQLSSGLFRIAHLLSRFFSQELPLVCCARAIFRTQPLWTSNHTVFIISKPFALLRYLFSERRCSPPAVLTVKLWVINVGCNYHFLSRFTPGQCSRPLHSGWN